MIRRDAEISILKYSWPRLGTRIVHLRGLEQVLYQSRPVLVNLSWALCCTTRTGESSALHTCRGHSFSLPSNWFLIKMLRVDVVVSHFRELWYLGICQSRCWEVERSNIITKRTWWGGETWAVRWSDTNVWLWPGVRGLTHWNLCQLQDRWVRQTSLFIRGPLQRTDRYSEAGLNYLSWSAMLKSRNGRSPNSSPHVFPFLYCYLLGTTSFIHCYTMQGCIYNFMPHKLQNRCTGIKIYKYT